MLLYAGLLKANTSQSSSYKVWDPMNLKVGLESKFEIVFSLAILGLVLNIFCSMAANNETNLSTTSNMYVWLI